MVRWGAPQVQKACWLILGGTGILMTTGLIRHRLHVGCRGGGEHGRQVRTVRHKMEGDATRWRVGAKREGGGRIPSYITSKTI